MKFRLIFALALAAGVITSCQKELDLLPADVNTESNESALKAAKAKNSGFVHGIEVDIDGELYYFKGAPDGMDGAIDVPGHYWVQEGKNRVVGKHYNTGPFGMASWWSSDAGDGTFLYKVDCIIDTWSPEKAEYYASIGYVHYHEFVSVEDGSLHPTKVPWLKHTAVTSFTFDRGPMSQAPDYPPPPYLHTVTPGIDWMFPINGTKPYDP